jgi:hypothetical protein
LEETENERKIEDEKRRHHAALSATIVEEWRVSAAG